MPKKVFTVAEKRSCGCHVTCLDRGGVPGVPRTAVITGNQHLMRQISAKTDMPVWNSLMSNAHLFAKTTILVFSVHPNYNSLQRCA